MHADNSWQSPRNSDTTVALTADRETRPGLSTELRQRQPAPRFWETQEDDVAGLQNRAYRGTQLVPKRVHRLAKPGVGPGSHACKSGHWEAGAPQTHTADSTCL